MIIDIRGTHGAGKSHIVHSLISEEDSVMSLMRDEDIVGTFLPNLRTAILGVYANVCGGCDQIKTADEICRRVRDFVDIPGVNHVVLEGILVAHTFNRYHELAQEMEDLGHRYIFAFLKAPLEDCIKRVQDRREARGQPREFDLGHITYDHKRIHQRLPAKFFEAGHEVKMFDSMTDEALTEIRKLLLGELK